MPAGCQKVEPFGGLRIQFRRKQMQVMFIITISMIKIILITVIIESCRKIVKSISVEQRETYKSLMRIYYDCKLILER